MSARWSLVGVIVMGALTALWVGFSLWYAVILFLDPQPIAKVLGGALAVLPLIAVWWFVVESRFVLGGQRLLRRLGEAGGLPVDDLPRLPSGRIDPAAGKAEFPRWQAEAEAAPEDWRVWVRLSLAYDAAGDRPRARATMRRAIAMERGASQE